MLAGRRTALASSKVRASHRASAAHLYPLCRSAAPPRSTASLCAGSRRAWLPARARAPRPERPGRVPPPAGQALGPRQTAPDWPACDVTQPGARLPAAQKPAAGDAGQTPRRDGCWRHAAAAQRAEAGNRAGVHCACDLCTRQRGACLCVLALLKSVQHQSESKQGTAKQGNTTYSTGSQNWRRCAQGASRVQGQRDQLRLQRIEADRRQTSPRQGCDAASLKSIHADCHRTSPSKRKRRPGCWPARAPPSLQTPCDPAESALPGGTGLGRPARMEGVEVQKQGRSGECCNLRGGETHAPLPRVCRLWRVQVGNAATEGGQGKRATAAATEGDPSAPPGRVLPAVAPPQTLRPQPHLRILPRAVPPPQGLNRAAQPLCRQVSQAAAAAAAPLQLAAGGGGVGEGGGGGGRGTGSRQSSREKCRQGTPPWAAVQPSQWVVEQAAHLKRRVSRVASCGWCSPRAARSFLRWCPTRTRPASSVLSVARTCRTAQGGVGQGELVGWVEMRGGLQGDGLVRARACKA